MREPVKRPPFSVRRQVAIAVAAPFFGQKGLQEGQSGCGLGQIIEAELEKLGLFEDVRGALNHLLRRSASDGDAEFTDAGTEQMGGDLMGCWHAGSRGIVPPK